MPAVLFLFTITNLVIGTGAFVLSGMLHDVARSLGVSVSVAGQAVTAYALAAAFVAPLLLVLTGALARKPAMLVALAAFTIGNLLSALASSMTLLLIGRVLMGASGSMFTAVSAGVVVALVAPERRGRALALAFLGMSMSYAVGVPFGAWLGMNHGWQVPIWLVTGACVLVMAVLAFALPREIHAPRATFAGLGMVMRQWDILRILLRTLLYFTAIFSVMAYAGPVMLALNPLTPGELSLMLMMFGFSGVAGSMFSGWVVDRIGALRAARRQLILLAGMMLLVPLTSGHPVVTIIVFVAWGIAGFGLSTSQQVMLTTRMLSQAPLVLSLNTSMLYVGSALGAAISGTFASLVGLDKLSWVGLPFALLGLLTLWSRKPARPKVS